MSIRTIYLLHFEPPYKHARHYLGIAHDLDQRIAQHQAGNGARLTQVATNHGCKLILVRTWKGEKTDERKLKNRKNSPTLCPLCNPKAERRARQ